LDLKHLKTFILVAETGSLSRASDRLRLAQPALSRHIRLLEASVGLPLFHRTGRGMQLTEAGQILLGRISGVVHQLDSALDEVRSATTAPRGPVALGMMPTVSYFLAARLMRRVAQELPEVSLRVVEGYAGHLIDWLHRGEVDATLLYGPASDVHARTTSLAFEELVLVGPATGNTTSLSSVPISALGNVDLVLPSRPHGLRAVIESAARKAGIALSVRFEADSFHVLKELTETGFGCTILPRSAIARELASGRLAATPIRRPKIMREVVLALPPGRSETRATAAVLAVLRREIADMIAAGDWIAVTADHSRIPRRKGANHAPA
jgi:DNA-binding transcriptional LysR family regulator